MLNVAMLHPAEPTPAPSRAEPAALIQRHPAAFILVEPAALGVSPNTLETLHWRIGAGRVKAQTVDRPKGRVWPDYRDSVQYRPAGHRADQHADSSLHQHAASTLRRPAAARMQAEALAACPRAYPRSVLEPLAAAPEDSDDAARELERENARLTARIEALRAARAESSGAPDPGRQSPDLATDTRVAQWWRLWPWVLAVPAVVVVAAAAARR
jgi:hypothetical protein